MTATSDERREAAGCLRGLAHDGIAGNVLPYLKGAVGLPARRTYRDVLLRLADLVDPTCYAIVSYEADDEYYCSECGCNLGIEIEDVGMLPNYCPHCGRRVVEDDSDGC